MSNIQLADPTVWFVSWKCSRRSRPDAWVSPPSTARAAMAMRIMRRRSAARPGDWRVLWRVAGGARGLFAMRTWLLMWCQYRCRRTRAVRLMLDGMTAPSAVSVPTQAPRSHRDAHPYSSRRSVRSGRLQRLTAGYREETSGVAGESPVRVLSRPLDGEATKAGRWGWASTTLACMSTRDTAKSRSFPSLEFRMSSLFLMTAYVASAS